MKAQTNTNVDGGCVRVGAYIVYVIGAVLSFVGYFVAWLFLTNVLKSHHKIAMHMFMLLAGHTQWYVKVANIIIYVLNFPDNHGVVIGIVHV